ncbi:MAG: hypothetical protein JNM60_08130 [Candidatus Competibacteraceae bacterium]|nr:hypothetical protein [Candidatus Competibacteraceae bacterium]
MENLAGENDRAHSNRATHNGFARQKCGSKRDRVFDESSVRRPQRRSLSGFVSESLFTPKVPHLKAFCGFFEKVHEQGKEYLVDFADLAAI